MTTTYPFKEASFFQPLLAQSLCQTPAFYHTLFAALPSMLSCSVPLGPLLYCVQAVNPNCFNATSPVVSWLSSLRSKNTQTPLLSSDDLATLAAQTLVLTHPYLLRDIIGMDRYQHLITLTLSDLQMLFSCDVVLNDSEHLAEQTAILALRVSGWNQLMDALSQIDPKNPQDSSQWLSLWDQFCPWQDLPNHAIFQHFLEESLNNQPLLSQTEHFVPFLRDLGSLSLFIHRLPNDWMGDPASVSQATRSLFALLANRFSDYVPHAIEQAAQPMDSQAVELARQFQLSRQDLSAQSLLKPLNFEPNPFIRFAQERAQVFAKLLVQQL